MDGAAEHHGRRGDAPEGEQGHDAAGAGVCPAPPAGARHVPAPEHRGSGDGRGYARAGRSGGRRHRRGSGGGRGGGRRRPDRPPGRGRHRRGAARAGAIEPHRRRPDPGPAAGGVRPRPVHAGRLLHPHPYRGIGQQAEQRRHRRPAGVHVGPLGRGHQPHRPGPHPGRDGPALLADHRPGPRPPPPVRHPGPQGRRPRRAPGVGGGRPQRSDDVADDRALLRRRGGAGQAVRPSGP